MSGDTTKQKNANPKKDAAGSLSAEDILSYLKDHPSFLQDHPKAIDYLVPPKQQNEKGIADFQSHMIRRLKEDKSKILETTRELVETSRANMNNQHRIQQAILCLLEARNFDQFIQAVTMDLSAILDVDITSFIVESNGRDIPHIHTNGIRILPPGTVDKWMEGKSVLLQSDIQGIEAIYGGGAMLVASQALLRVDISMNTPPALLCFGSRDPYLFTDTQATDQIQFLARVVERSFRSWLNLPHIPE